MQRLYHLRQSRDTSLEFVCVSKKTFESCRNLINKGVVVFFLFSLSPVSVWMMFSSAAESYMGLVFGVDSGDTCLDD